LVITEVQSKSFMLVTERRHEIGCAVCRQSYFCLMDVIDCNTRHIVVVECGIARLLCAMRVLEVRTSCSSPRLLPLCQKTAKFRFFHSVHWWASPWRKIAYSINHSLSHSLTQLISCPGNRR